MVCACVLGLGSFLVPTRGMSAIDKGVIDAFRLCPSTKRKASGLVTLAISGRRNYSVIYSVFYSVITVNYSVKLTV